MRRVLCTVCARGGSKGVPNKNLRMLRGRPLIVHTIEQGLSTPSIGRVVVSTDSREIAALAKEAGAEVPFLRPSELATDEAPKLPVIQHAVRRCMQEWNERPELIVDLDPTSPLRTVEDIEGCIHLALDNPECESVITGYRSNKNPYFNMVEIGPSGYATLSKPGANGIGRRQDAPVVYAMNASIYVWRREALFKRERVVSGAVRLYEMPEERSIDIDSEVDFKLVELLMEQRKQNDLS